MNTNTVALTETSDSDLVAQSLAVLRNRRAWDGVARRDTPAGA